ncbi:Sulfotransferase family [Nesidiocoris tenuis]|uniref:Carbohydrate sulfotransferase n=1 Tax=Nesidiocoris tenuis TaxID=355587 RepID=A0ABN7B8D4_9HEMI|nr:Sulfotransferase family [Nesidiocoris tenuis]
MPPLHNKTGVRSDAKESEEGPGGGRRPPNVATTPPTSRLNGSSNSSSTTSSPSPYSYENTNPGMNLSNLLRYYQSFRVGALTKFVLFFLFTTVYIYIAVNSMPARPAKRVGSTRNTNITSKIINRIEEQGLDLYAIEEEMATRRDRVSSTCQNLHMPEKPSARTWEFVVDAHHSLVWCKILKAASSTWIYYFNLLSGFEEPFLRSTKQKPWFLLRSKFPKPTISQLIRAFRSSLSFIIVRDPLERLLSIYDSIVSPANQKYYQQLRQKIRESNPSRLSLRGIPSFEEFARYVIKTKDSVEMWSPMHKLCSPCFVNFTVIAKFETLQDDQEYVIKRAGVDDILKPAKVKLQFLAHRADETKDLKLKQRFSELEGKLILELIEMYRTDFEMFGYNSTKYYYMIKELVIK